MTIVVFGIYCRTDKEGIFFRVNGKKKKDLWPLVKKYCHSDTSVVCTDSAKQYVGVEQLFTNAVHKTVNHKKGEYVSSTDKENHINSIENQNKLLKQAMHSRRTDTAIRQDMALHFYRRRRLDHLPTFGEQVHQFLMDIKSVYPGCGKVGLSLQVIDLPTPESEGILHLMPRSSKEDLESENDEDEDEEVPFIDDLKDIDWNEE